MRLVFMGTPWFAAEVLQLLVADHDVVAVYTRPDAVRGRGKKLLPSPVKAMAELLDIPVYTPKNFKDSETVTELASLEPDAIVVTAYGVILPRTVLDIPPYGCLNVHSSLLPRWRGAAPVQSAILAGDAEVGVCIMKMDEGLDTGPYTHERSVPIGSHNVSKLLLDLALIGGEALLDVLNGLEAGTIEWTEQDESLSTYAPKLGKHELYLRPNDSTMTNLRRIQASDENHVSRIQLGTRSVTVLDAERWIVGEEGEENLPDETGRVLTKQMQERLREWLTEAGLGPDEMVPGLAFADKKHIYLTNSDGLLMVSRLKPDGKGAMDAAAFIAGNPRLRQGVVSWSEIE